MPVAVERLCLPVLACIVLTSGCGRFGKKKGTDGGADDASPTGSASSAPDVPSEPGIVPISDPACVLKTTELPPVGPLSPRGVVKLRAGGKTFASFDEAKEVEVRFALGANGGTALVKTKLGSFAGEMRLSDVLLAPKKGAAATPAWLTVRSVRPTQVDADKVLVKMYVPQAVNPVMPIPQSYPCADLAIGNIVQETPHDAATLKKETDLKTEGGEIIARLVLPKKPPAPTKPGLGVGVPEPSTIAILDHAGKKTKVRVLGLEADFEGWVEGNVLVKKTTQPLGMMGLVGGSKAAPPIRVRCTDAIGIYVDDGDRTLRVGTLDANVIIESTRTDGVRSFLDLGAHSDFAAMLSGEEFAHPYVKSKTVALCAPATDAAPSSSQ